MKGETGLHSIKLNTIAGKVVIAVSILLTVAFIYFAGKAGLANSLADQPGSIEMAEYAVDLAQDDPQTHYALAILRSRTFSPENAEISQKELEKAAALSPNNYLIWIVLGEVRERNGDISGAETAMRRAYRLAPSYASTSWALGNLLYRQGNNDESLPLINRAAADMQKYAPPAAMLLMHIYQNDQAGLKNAVKGNANLIAAMAAVFANEKRSDETVEFWQMIPDGQRADHVESAKNIYNLLIADKRYGHALLIANDAMPQAKLPTVGSIANGSFEDDISPEASGPFLWNIQAGNYPLIAVSDEFFTEGSKSLIFVFNDPLSRVMRSVSQTAAVVGGQKYRFKIKARADIKTQGSLKWIVSDAKTGEKLAETKPVSQGLEWQDLEAIFDVPPGIDGVILTTAEAQCVGSKCALNGNIWFDDAKLEVVN